MSRSSNLQRNMALLVTSVIMIAICFALDKKVNEWLEVHPLMSNIIAGLPGIPLGAVIISFFVERSIERERQRERRRIQDYTIARINSTWETLSAIIVQRFSLDEISDFREDITTVEEIWSAFSEYEGDYVLMVRRKASYPPPVVTLPLGVRRAHQELIRRSFQMYPAGIPAVHKRLENRILMTLVPRLDRTEEDVDVALYVDNFSDAVVTLREALDALGEWSDVPGFQLDLSSSTIASWALVSEAPARLQALSSLRAVLDAAESAVIAGSLLSHVNSQPLTNR